MDRIFGPKCISFIFGVFVGAKNIILNICEKYLNFAKNRIYKLELYLEKNSFGFVTSFFSDRWLKLYMDSNLIERFNIRDRKLFKNHKIFVLFFQVIEISS